jgi:hypothetical protein
MNRLDGIINVYNGTVGAGHCRMQDAGCSTVFSLIVFFVVYFDPSQAWSRYGLY